MITDILPRSSPIHQTQSAPVYSKLSNSLHSTPTKQSTISPSLDRPMPMDHPIQEEELGDSTTEVDSEESNQNNSRNKTINNSRALHITSMKPFRIEYYISRN